MINLVCIPIFDSSTYYNLHFRSWKSGKETGKVIAVGTRLMHCRVYSNKKSSEPGAKYHDCRANWGGSSRGMDSDLAVEMLNTQKYDTFQVSTIIGDDDSTTKAMERQQVNHQVEKWSDVNHAKKSRGTVTLSLTKDQFFSVHAILRNFQHLPISCPNTGSDKMSG